MVNRILKRFFVYALNVTHKLVVRLSTAEAQLLTSKNTFIEYVALYQVIDVICYTQIQRKYLFKKLKYGTENDQ